ncbi:MAG: hypothetical protein QN163_00875 [Armatimonadota bacterium]|nr:hypothetical protein [Armatimonadota bacterium]MDR5697373.1 hypothetical protein [Armatimonadota bacterium]
MARPRYSANKRQRELKKKAERERKLARKHARRTSTETPTGDGGRPDVAQEIHAILPTGGAASPADPD